MKIDSAVILFVSIFTFILVTVIVTNTNVTSWDITGDHKVYLMEVYDINLVYSYSLFDKKIKSIDSKDAEQLKALMKYLTALHPYLPRQNKF